MRLLRSQAGDTIVEVLIAMAVASGVLGASYVVVNHTLANSRQAQEHAEALQIASSQVERITSLAVTNPTNLFSVANRFHCVATDGTLVNMPTTVISLPADEASYPAACKNLGTVGYRTAFQYVNAQNLFQVYVNWPSAAGNGDDQVNISYKVRQ